MRRIRLLKAKGLLAESFNSAVHLINMKYFAEFYHLSTGYIAGTIPPQLRKPIPACGSGSVLPLDGRFSKRTMARVAADVCRTRGFIGFTLTAGKSFMESREIRAYEGVN